MTKEHRVIIIPGLGDHRTKTLELSTRHWHRHGFEPSIHAVGWRDGEHSFKPKLARLIAMIDQFVEQGDVVSLIGTSAGGSAALNAFSERRDVIHRVITVCARLRIGPTIGSRSFASMSKSSRAFAESVELCEAQEIHLSAADRDKIMTVRARFGDELVPPETSVLPGALNTTVPTFEHMFSIGAALTFFSQPLLVFLQSNEIREDNQ